MDVLSLHTTEAKPARANFAGLDAVRGFAALGLVLFHSCIPYLNHPMPGLVWPVRDRASQFIDLAYWSVELFIMPLFLVMAGFLAWKSLQNRGEIALVKSRAKRLLIPLLFGVLVVLPLDLYCWLLGWVTEGILPIGKLRSLKFDGGMDRDLWGLSHLWFLQYLFLYVVVAAVVSILSKRFQGPKRLASKPRIMVALVMLLGTITLYVSPEVVWGFQHAFVPVPSKWIYSGLFFVLGAMLAVHDFNLSWLAVHARRMIAPAIVVSIAAVLLGRWHLSGGDNKTAQVILAGLTCSSAMLVTLSIVGSAVARIDRVSGVIGYLAAASFWVYIVHHPILGLIHIDLKVLLPDASPILKTFIASAVTCGICLITYEQFVRHTALGRWLGFTWESPSTADVQESSARTFPLDPAGATHTSRRAA